MTDSGWLRGVEDPDRRRRGLGIRRVPARGVCEWGRDRAGAGRLQTRRAAAGTSPCSSPRATAMSRPQPFSATRRRPPFVNGANTVTAYVADYGGNVATQTRDGVRRQRAAATRRSRTSWTRRDPELIRAAVADAHSGVAPPRSTTEPSEPRAGFRWTRGLSGDEARARVDSSAVPPGEYEFRADVARRRWQCVRDHAPRGRVPDEARLPAPGAGGAEDESRARAGRPARPCRMGPSRRCTGGCWTPTGEPLAGAAGRRGRPLRQRCALSRAPSARR